MRINPVNCYGTIQIHSKKKETLQATTATNVNFQGYKEVLPGAIIGLILGSIATGGDIIRRMPEVIGVTSACALVGLLTDKHNDNDNDNNKPTDDHHFVGSC